MKRPARIFAPLLLAPLVLGPVPGCARALRDAPALGPGAAAAEDVEALLSRAALLYSERSPEKVREAAEVWLEAARADAARVDGYVGAARAMVWLADHEIEAPARGEAALRAVHAAQWCAQARPEEPACAFWLGAALGVQARERPSTGLDALPRIEEAFRRAAAGDPAQEEAGPDRALALFYARAPGWPAGPGDPDRALDHARRAAALRPDFPPNQAALAEALEGVGEREEAAAAWRRALDLARRWSSRGDKDAGEWIHEAEAALAGRGRSS